MYRIKSSGQIASQGELRKLFANTSFPRIWDESVLDHIGVDPVFESPTPTTTRYQTSFKDGLEQDAKGRWLWKWTIGPVFTDRPATEDEPAQTAAEQQAAYVRRIDEAQAKSVREQRNKLIAECDWTQVADSPVDKEVWATYRQALRDVPVQEGFPWAVIWPIQPE